MPLRPSEYDELILQLETQYGLPPNLLKAVVERESNYDPLAMSPAGAKGLTQLMDDTAREVGVTNVWDAAENLAGGARYLQKKLREFRGDIPLALAAYNAGAGAVNRYGGIPPFKETQDYVRAVMTSGAFAGYDPRAAYEEKLERGLKGLQRLDADFARAQGMSLEDAQVVAIQEGRAPKATLEQLREDGGGPPYEAGPVGPATSVVIGEGGAEGGRLEGVLQELDKLRRRQELGLSTQEELQRLQLVEGFVEDLGMPQRVTQYLDNITAIQRERERTDGSFLAAIPTAWVRGAIGANEFFQQFGIALPKDTRFTGNVLAQALGFIPFDQDDPVSAYHAVNVRAYLKENHPSSFATIARGVKFNEDHPILSMGAELLAWLPLALVEGAALPGLAVHSARVGKAVLSAKGVAASAGIGALEAFVMTPGDTQQRAVTAAIVAPFGAAIGSGFGLWQARGLNRGMAKVATAEGSTIRREIPELLSLSDGDPAKNLILGAVDSGLVDARSVVDMHAAGMSMNDIGGHIARVASELEDAPSPFARPGADSTPSAYLARVRATAELEADRLVEDWPDRLYLLARDFNDAERAVVTRGVTGANQEAFVEMLRGYARRKSGEIGEEVIETVRQVQRDYPGLDPDMLEYLASRLFNPRYQAALRGVDGGIETNVVSELVESVNDTLMRAHPDSRVVDGQVQLAGRMRVVDDNIDAATPMLKFAIDLMADHRPGRIATVGVHEMAHAYLYSLEQVNPQAYRRLAGEVLDIYSRQMEDFARVGELDNPDRVAELFANLLTNETLRTQAVAGGTFIGFLQGKFGSMASELVDSVADFRNRYFKVKRMNPRTNIIEYHGPAVAGPWGTPARPWSKELQRLSRQFAANDWGSIYDSIRMERTGRRRGVRTNDVAYHLRDMPIEDTVRAKTDRLVWVRDRIRELQRRIAVKTSRATRLTGPASPGAVAKRRAATLRRSLQRAERTRDRRAPVAQEALQKAVAERGRLQRETRAAQRRLAAASAARDRSPGPAADRKLSQASRAAQASQRRLDRAEETVTRRRAAAAQVGTRAKQLASELKTAERAVERARRDLGRLRLDENQAELATRRQELEDLNRFFVEQEAEIRRSSEQVLAELDLVRQRMAPLDTELIDVTRALEDATGPERQRLRRRERSLQRQLDAARAEADQVDRRLRWLRRQTGPGGQLQDTDIWTAVEFMGLEEPLEVRVDVRHQFLRAARNIDYSKVMRAILSQESLEGVSEGLGVPIADPEINTVGKLVRRAAEWYTRGNAAFDEMATQFRAIAREVDPEHAPIFDRVDAKTMGLMVGVQGASRGPWENLQAAIRGLGYLSRMPGGHHTAAMTRDQAMRANLVWSLREFPEANALDVVRYLAEWNNRSARNVLAKPDHPGYPQPGQTWLDWLQRTSMREFDGALKLASYSANLQGNRDVVTNDIWQFRFFLWNQPEVTQGMYQLGTPGGVTEYMRAIGTRNATAGDDRALLSALTRREGELVTEMVEATPTRRAEIEVELEDLRAQQAVAGTRGADIWNGSKWVPYVPNTGEYLLMSDIQHRLARRLNAIDPNPVDETGAPFWTGERVQAAIWALMRGKFVDSGADGLQDFGLILGRALEGESPPFHQWVREGIEAGARDAESDVFARSSNEIVNPHGHGHPLNQLYRAFTHRAVNQGLSDDQVYRTASDLITANNKLALGLSFALRTKKTDVNPGHGYWGGNSVRTAIVELQGRPDQLDVILSAVAASNRQHAFEWAETATFHRLGEQPEDFAGYMLDLGRVSGLAEARERFDAIKDRVASAAGRDLVEGATVSVVGGDGYVRISKFGIVDDDAFQAYIPDACRVSGAGCAAWSGRTQYVDSADLLRGNSSGARGEINGEAPNSPWRQAWETGSDDELRHRGVLEGDPGPGFAADLEGGRIIAGHHLARALRKAPREIRGEVLRQYLVAERQKLSIARNILEEPEPGALRDGAVVDRQAWNEWAEELNAGTVLQLVHRLEPETLPESLLAETLEWNARQAGLTNSPDYQPYITGTEVLSRRIGLQQAERKFWQTLDTPQRMSLGADEAEAAAARFSSLGDQRSASVRARLATRARGLSKTAAQLSDESTSSPAVMPGPRPNILETIWSELGTGGHVRSLARGMVEAMRLGYRSLFKNLFEGVNRLDPMTSNLMNNALSPGIEASQMTRRIATFVLDGLSEQERTLFERFLQHEKAKVALERAAASGDEVSAHLQGLMLSPAELEFVSGNANVQRALERHINFAQPEIEAIFLEIDPENARRLMQTDSRAFMTSMKFDERIHGPESATRVVTVGTTRSVPEQFRVPKGSAFAKRFKGTAVKYVIDYEKILDFRLNRDLQVLRQRELLRHLEAEGLAIPHTPGMRAPEPGTLTTPRGDVDIAWRRIQASDVPRWVQIADEAEGAAPRKVQTRYERYWVPTEVAEGWEYIMAGGRENLRFGRNAKGRKNLFFQVADFTTAAMLATFAEASRHSLRVLAGVARLPTPNPGGGEIAAKFLLPYIGSRGHRMLQMMNIYNSPEALHLERWMARINALPGRAFEETRVTFSGSNRAARTGNWLMERVHRGREFLFDLPDVNAKGGFRGGPFGIPVPRRLWGFDVRARLLAAKIYVEHLKVTGQLANDADVASLARKANPHDAALREYLTQFGMFNTNVQTKIVQNIRRLRLNPFAGSQAGFRPAEIESLFGLHRLPKEGMTAYMKAFYASQVIGGGWLGYVGALMIANKALSGHWPWENQEGREFDLELPFKEADGAPGYIEANFIEPQFSRAARTTGLRFLFDERYGTTVGERFLRSLQQRGIQEIASFTAAGPPVQFLTTAISGRAPFLSGGQLLRLAAPKGTATAQALENLKVAMINLNGNFHAAFSDSIATSRHPEDPRLWWSLHAPHALFGRIGRLGSSPIVEQGTLARAEQRRSTEIVFHHVRRYTETQDPHHRREIYQNFVNQFKPGLRRNKAIRKFWDLHRGLPRGAGRRAAEARLLRQGL